MVWFVFMITDVLNSYGVKITPTSVGHMSSWGILGKYSCTLITDKCTWRTGYSQHICCSLANL